MGVSVMCPGLGLDPGTSLSSSNNYQYPVSNDDYLNSSNYISTPHWRKFKIVGLIAGNNIVNGGQIMFVHKASSGSGGAVPFPNTTMLTPEIVNGEVYFYIHCERQNNSGNHCVQQTNIAMSIPLTHSLMVQYNYNGSGGSWGSSSKSFFEIFYESNGGMKTTGIIFDK